jgi:predicted lipid-binding transport protein (Tim44 family)
MRPLFAATPTHHIPPMITNERNAMRRTSSLLAAVAALSLALAPGLAEARLGGGSSQGSRGSMTNSAPPSTRTAPSGAQPMQRSMTPNQPSPGTAQPGYGGAAATAPSRGSSFMSGLMGGLIGAGIGGLLLGHGFFGGGLGFGGFLGFLLQIFLIVVIARFVIRWFRSRSGQPATAGGPNIFARTMNGGPSGQAPLRGAPSGGPAAVSIGPGDYGQFEQLLQATQAAWSAQDLNALRAMVTPEMLGYFSEQLSDQASRGWRNTVTEVRLESGDLAQAWAEDGREYATVAMRFSMVDVTRDTSGRVVEGDQNRRTEATELWTFVRSRGGQWILSAIQQAR